MIRKIHKMFVNFEKEERWINKMASKGLNFVDYSFVKYRFEEGVPGEYIYRLLLLEEMPSHPESQVYLKFLEETGVECVSTYFRWIYLRKKACDGPFEIYTDLSSKIKHFKRIIYLLGTILLVNVGLVISNVIIGINLDSPVNIYIPIINLLAAVILTPPTLSYLKNVKRMERENQLHE